LIQSEFTAFQWLKEQGYKESEIVKNRHGSPDFICTDKRFEVKKTFGNTLVFSPQQVQTLKPDDVIIVVDEGKVTHTFPWKDRKTSPFKVNVFHTEKTSQIKILLPVHKLVMEVRDLLRVLMKRPDLDQSEALEIALTKVIEDFKMDLATTLRVPNSKKRVSGKPRGGKRFG